MKSKLYQTLKMQIENRAVRSGSFRCIQLQLIQSYSTFIRYGHINISQVVLSYVSLKLLFNECQMFGVFDAIKEITGNELHCFMSFNLVTTTLLFSSYEHNCRRWIIRLDNKGPFFRCFMTVCGILFILYHNSLSFSSRHHRCY